MKKILSLLLVLLLSLGLSACNNSISKNNEVEQATVDPIQERKEMLGGAFINCCDSDSGFASLSADNTSLVIDTNPNDTKYSYFNEEKALAAIVATNSYLKFPSSITDKMSSTRALDGMQTQSGSDFTATWTYHPDKGLRVIYEINFS